MAKKKFEDSEEIEFVNHAPETTQGPTTEGAAVPEARVYSTATTIDHDLYRLKVSDMKKNISWSSEPEYTKIKHEHFYHTVDSNGTKLKESSKVGSHFHVMELVSQGPGKPPIVKCGPAMKEVKVKRDGRWVRGYEPYLGEEDQHTHVVEYIRSDKIQPRTLNAQAAVVVGREAQKLTPPDGVVG